MSISTRIEAIEQHLTDDYSVLEVAGADLTNVDKNIVNLKMTWQERLLYFINNGTDVVWNNWEKVEGTGESLSLNNTEEAPMKINLKGNTSQEGTPTPETPQDIHVVSGDNTITVSNSDNTQSQSYPINLGDIELCKIGDYQDSIKKSTGKNLFDKDNANVLDGMFINAVAGNIGSNANATSIYIPIKPNTTYCVSKTKGNRFAIGYSSTTPAVNVSLTNIADDRTKTSLTSTSASDSKYLVIYISLSDTETYENIISTIQIEYGNTPTDFEPYGKVWYLNKQIGKMLLNGSENWNYTNSVFYLTYSTGASSIAHVRAQNYIPYSNNFKGVINYHNTGQFYNNSQNNNFGLNLDATQHNIYVRCDSITSKEDFKTWLTTHNTSIYYPLATPTYTEITDSTLISQLEALNGAKSYNPQTNVSQDNNDLPFILDVTALKQLN